MGVFAVILQQLNCSLGYVYVSHAYCSTQWEFCIRASLINSLMLGDDLLEPLLLCCGICHA